MGRDDRSRSVVPVDTSSFVNCWLTVATEASSLRAAAVTEPSSAAATKTSTPQSVILPAASVMGLYPLQPLPPGCTGAPRPIARPRKQE